MTRPTDKKPARPSSKGPASKGGKTFKRGFRPQDAKRDQKIKEGETRPGDRIAKVLARAGIASRRDAEVMIEEGRVTVNGRTVVSPALNVLPKDRITVDGKEVGDAEPPRMWLYHKPTGLVTTEKDEKGRDTVFANLPKNLPRVMSVGRLDITSEGLLLLTNDGELKRLLELPDTGWMRKYRVRVKGNATEATLEPLRKGITIDGENFQPMEVVFDRQQGANAWLTVGIREGKNREIRRAMEHVGLTVNRLIRISYGPFRLGFIKPGEVEEVKPRILRDQLGIDIEDGSQPKRQVSRDGRDSDAGREFKPRNGDRDGGFKKRDGDRDFKKRDGDRDGGFKPREGGGFKGKGGPRRDDRDGAGRGGDRDGKAGGFKSKGFKSHGGGKDGKPRSAGFKSHGGGSDGKPRSGGFKSHGKPSGKPRSRD
ncbi:pseudouridine synthase [Celeribacter sp.]|uniref:pseudouridine synthase n=1 Tax=Celeribacter sp. TaxID=1890673 RepID=UPI003A91E0D3